MKKLVILISFLFLLSFVSAVSVPDKLQLSIQTTHPNGTVISGTFNLVFNISTTSNCNNVVYSNSTTQTTDDRGIVSYYLENVNLPFNESYYLCYYRDGSLKSSSELVRVPYSFNSKYLSGYNASFFVPLNTSVYGTFDFNGGWTSGGLTIQNGSIYADTGYFYNLTSLNVANLAINGSLFPQTGFNNTFDVGSGSLKWKNLWLGGDANVDGNLNVGGSVTVGGSGLGNSAFLNVGTGPANVASGDHLHSIYLLNTGDSATGNYSFDTNTFFIDSTNNRVGINKSDPSSALDINGVLTIYHPGSTADIQPGSGEALYIDAPDNDFVVQDSTDAVQNFIWRDFSTQKLFLGTTNANVFFRSPVALSDQWLTNDGDAEGIRIDNSGRVGINTSSPSYIFHVNGRAAIQSISSSETAGFFALNDTGSEVAFIGVDQNYNPGFWGGDGAGWNFIMNKTSGNVGIGTQTPKSTLSIGGPGPSSGAGIYSESVSSPAGYFNNSLGTGYPGLVVANGNYVGIGAITPTYTLQILNPSSGNIDPLFIGRGSESQVTWNSGTELGIGFGDDGNGPIGRMALKLTGDGSFGFNFYTSPQNWFGANSNPALVLTGNNTVGINTSTPKSKLSVGGSGNPNAGIYGQGNTYGVYGFGSYGVYGAGGTGTTYGVYGSYGGGGTGYAVYGHSSSTSGYGGYFSNTAGGTVVVGAQDSSNTCDFGVDGTGWAASCTSDARLKHNIKNLSESDIKNITSWTLYYANHIRKFQWNSDNSTDYSNIAQELQKVYPEKVSLDSNGTYLQASPPQTNDILVTIAYQQKMILSQKNTLNFQQSQIDSLQEELCSKDNSYSWCE